MAYMRDTKQINISGSTQKRKLRYMGYYHGYKGYRYCNRPNDLFQYRDFNELQAVYDFDIQVKSILYPQIMFLETAMKNIVLECVLEESHSERFADIFATLLTDYKRHSVGSENFKKALEKRLALRQRVYASISRSYMRPMVSHYYEKDKPVPIWAIFELLNLGEFQTFISCLNINIKKKISLSLGIKNSFDGDGELTPLLVFALKDLRNAVAHNATVFDTRFKNKRISTRISTYIMTEVGITNVTFNTILDYIILISFLMKSLKCNKTDVLAFISRFEDAYENLRKQVPTNIFTKIIYTDTRGKLNALKNYCRN